MSNIVALAHARHGKRLTLEETPDVATCKCAGQTWFIYVDGAGDPLGIVKFECVGCGAQLPALDDTGNVVQYSSSQNWKPADKL